MRSPIKVACLWATLRAADLRSRLVAVVSAAAPRGARKGRRLSTKGPGDKHPLRGSDGDWSDWADGLQGERARRLENERPDLADRHLTTGPTHEPPPRSGLACLHL
jgi:hypothetical protein